MSENFKGEVECIGMMLPVIATKGNCHLVAHPNGPGLVCGQTLATMEYLLYEDEEDIDFDVPRRELAIWAIREYTKWSWRLLGKTITLPTFDPV